jgi:uncharacterized protein (DUF1501 family)
MFSRRVFIKSGAAAMVAVGFAPSFLARAVEAAGSRKKLLIAIFQRGAVDGLNMVVPYGESEYYRARPTIAIAKPGAADGAIELDGFFGLHPRMAALAPIWERGDLAIVHATGSPDTTRSHFDAQDYMESATPGVKSTRDGWLNRYLQGSGIGDQGSDRNPLRGVALTRQMPRSLQGAAPAVAMGSAAEFTIADMAARTSFEEIYQAATDRTLNGTAAEAFDAMTMLARKTSSAYSPSNGARYPRSPFGLALQEIARLAKSEVGLEIAFAESTQWDHHVNEGSSQGQIAGRLDDFSRGIAALAQDLGERMADTVIVTMSEFGRAVAENGSRGTDHGHGNAMFVIGGGVKGRQVYGKWPGLRAEQRFEGRDLAVTTHFRVVFNEILGNHLAASADARAKVFPGFGAGTDLKLF